MTEAGLNTVNLSQMTTFQQIILFLLMLLGSTIWVSIAVVYFRRKAFERRFKSIVEEEKQRRRNRSASRRRRSGSRSQSRPEVDGVVVRGRAKPLEQNCAEVVNGHLKEPFEESQPCPKPDAKAESPEADNSSLGPSQAGQPWSTDTDLMRRITFASPASPTRGRRHRRVFTMQGVGARPDVDIHPISSPRPRYPGRLPTTNEDSVRSLPLPRHATLTGAFVGRNSQFSNLSLAEREEIGGVEYRAVTYLAIIVPLYYILWQLLGCIGLGAYVASKGAAMAEVNSENPWYNERISCLSLINSRQLTPLQGGLVLSSGYPLSTIMG